MCFVQSYPHCVDYYHTELDGLKDFLILEKSRILETELIEQIHINRKTTS